MDGSSRWVTPVALAAALGGCSLDWPPPIVHAEAAPPSDCDRCTALAKHARPDAPPEGASRVVPAGGDLQAALDAAAPGDEIVLEAGATFAGSFRLPVKQGDRYITVRSSAEVSTLPGPCTRIGPEHFENLPKLIGPAGEPALIAADGAHHYRFVAVELTIEPGPPFPTGIVEIGQGTETDPDLSPHHIELDRVWVHGDPMTGSNHGVVMNGGETKLLNAWVSDIKSEVDFKSAVAGWNGPGPLVVMNDHLESAGTTVTLGLGAPAIAGLVPSDVEIGYCDLTRPLAWRKDDPAWDGSAWRTGDAVMIASAQRVTIEGNLIENVWDYYPFVLEPGAPEGGEPWGVVEDVTIASNLVRDVYAGFMIQAGPASDPARHTQRIAIRDNLMTGVGAFAGEGRLFGILGGIRDLTVEHDTMLQTHHVFYADNGQNAGFVFDDSIVNHNEYGMWCGGFGLGTKCLEGSFPGYEVRRNVLVGLPMGTAPTDYPPNNFFPAYDVGFVDAPGGDYHLAPSSPYKGKATDGTDIGVRFDAQDAAATCRTPP